VSEEKDLLITLPKKVTSKNISPFAHSWTSNSERSFSVRPNQRP